MHIVDPETAQRGPQSNGNTLDPQSPAGQLNAKLSKELESNTDELVPLFPATNLGSLVEMVADTYGNHWTAFEQTTAAPLNDHLAEATEALTSYPGQIPVITDRGLQEAEKARGNFVDGVRERIQNFYKQNKRREIELVEEYKKRDNVLLRMRLFMIGTTGRADGQLDYPTGWYWILRLVIVGALISGVEYMGGFSLNRSQSDYYAALAGSAMIVIAYLLLGHLSAKSCSLCSGWNSGKNAFLQKFGKYPKAVDPETGKAVEYFPLDSKTSLSAYISTSFFAFATLGLLVWRLWIAFTDDTQKGAVVPAAVLFVGSWSFWILEFYYGHRHPKHYGKAWRAMQNELGKILAKIHEKAGEIDFSPLQTGYQARIKDIMAQMHQPAASIRSLMDVIKSERREYQLGWNVLTASYTRTVTKLIESICVKHPAVAEKKGEQVLAATELLPKFTRPSIDFSEYDRLARSTKLDLGLPASCLITEFKPVIEEIQKEEERKIQDQLDQERAAQEEAARASFNIDLQTGGRWKTGGKI